MMNKYLEYINGLTGFKWNLGNNYSDGDIIYIAFNSIEEKLKQHKLFDILKSNNIIYNDSSYRVSVFIKVSDIIQVMRDNKIDKILE